MRDKSAKKPKLFMYGPQNDFSANMLMSIPQKVVAWLQTLGHFTPKGHYRSLYWDVKKSGNAVSLLLIDGEAPVQIMWNGSQKKMRGIRGTESWFELIDRNLDKFVQLEQRVYDDLEALQKEVDLEHERNLQALQTTGIN